jgi:AcrR family transcriptional regulator
MAGNRRLTEQGRERKQQLLDVAATLFSRRGYAATRVADICDEAGVAKGLFYWYFENKEAVFAELVSSMRLRLRKAQAEAIDPTADPVTQVRQGTEASVRFMAEHASYFALLEVETRDQELASLLRSGGEVHRGDTEKLIRQAMSTGLVPDDEDPRLLATTVVGTVAHLANAHRNGRLELSIEELASFAGRWVVRALGGEPYADPGCGTPARAVTTHAAAGRVTPESLT